MGLTTLIGFAGGLAVLVSFAGVACGRLSSQSATYHAMNLAGAAAMVAAGLPAGAWPSVAVNGSWALISAYGLAPPIRLRPWRPCAARSTVSRSYEPKPRNGHRQRGSRLGT
jgi:hypothetical protein